MKKLYRRDQIETARETLSALPELERENFSLRETIEELSNELQKLRASGYSLKQIAESLHGAGIDISTPTLRAYLTVPKDKRKRRSSRKSPKATNLSHPLPDGSTKTSSNIRPDRERV